MDRRAFLLGSLAAVAAACAPAEADVRSHGRRRHQTTTSNPGSTALPNPPPPAPYVAHDKNLSPVGAIRTDLPLTGVNVPAGTTDLQAIINANPAGTQYNFDPVTYYFSANSVLRAHSTDVFTGQVGTKFTGNGLLPCAFSSAGTSTVGVTIQNIVFDGYVSTAVSPSLATITPGSGWFLQDCEITNDNGPTGGGIAVWMGSGSTVQRCYLHHNDHYGAAGPGTNGSSLLNNDIAYNNWQHHYNGMDDAGGTKFARAAANLTMRYNNVHHNGGPGLWVDGFGDFIIYDQNLCEYNDGPGLDHEISYRATLSNNVVRYNMAYYLDPANTPGSSRSILYGADINISTSNGTSASPIDIYGNTVISLNSNGIGLIDSDRGLGASYGPFPGVPLALANVSVHDNDFTLLTGLATTVAGAAGRAAIYSANNRFLTNTYRTPNLTGTWWNWSAGKITKAAWQTAGQDTAGTFLVSA